MEHMLLRPAPTFAQRDEYASMMFEQQLATGYSHAWNQSFDSYAATSFDHESMPSLQMDSSQFCALSPEHLDEAFCPISGMHGQHRESLHSSNLGMEQRVIFPTESWSSLCPQERMGSPVDTISSCKSSHTHSPMPRVISNGALAVQHYATTTFQHLDGPSAFFQEAEPAVILPSQYIHVEMDQCHVGKLEDESEITSPRAPQIIPAEETKFDDAHMKQEGSSDESELAWPQRDRSDADSDYNPRPSANRRRSQAARGKGSSTATSKSKIVKKTAIRQRSLQCPHRAAFAAEVQRSSRGDGEYERRSFTCLGRPYGCQTTFTSKNEWKRHVISQHLCLGYWRCDLCPVDREKCPNDFNRKDLFTQHLRRMHAPASTTGAIVTPSSKTSPRRSKSRPKPTPEDEEFAREIVRIRERCWVQARQPPSHLDCSFCQQSFKGDAACLEDFLEHVGRHLAITPGDEHSYHDSEQQHEANSAAFQKNGTLREWMVSNGLLRRTGGRWELCHPATVTTASTSSWGSADAEGDPE